MSAPAILSDGGEGLKLEAVSFAYGKSPVLENISMEVADGEIISVVGESGSGKTTLLRAIAGLEKCGGGQIHLNECPLDTKSIFIAPEKRGIGLVFQDFALFPHMTVAQNVGFGLRGAREQENERVRQLLAMTDLQAYEDSYPHMLSGGQQQRVALARALAPEPHLLLMDEPFSGLDGFLRESVRLQTLEILRGAGISAIIVTHDAQEAMLVSDRIAVLHEGRLEQFDTPKNLYTSPANAFVAQVFSPLNHFSGVVDEEGYAQTTLGAIPVSGFDAGVRVDICFRPEKLKLGRGKGIACRLKHVAFMGREWAVHVRLESGEDVQIFAQSAPEVGENELLYLGFESPDDALIFPV